MISLFLIFKISLLLPRQLIVVGNKSEQFCIICKLDNGARRERGRAVVGEQSIKQRTQYTPLRSPCVGYLGGKGIATHSHLLCMVCKKNYNLITKIATDAPLM